ncbi:MAG TPA: shikimate dehydrogenase [Kofleriaceae bacterium]|nr:shikimate dehydrogenase [Kofleriaceae bacterium]
MSSPAVAISGKTRVAAVLGWPVEHSRSPAMLNAAFAVDRIDAVLVPIGVPPESLASIVTALRAMRALGASVTLPHKVAVAALCDELSPEARAIGAVNCLQFTDDRLVGHNTDCDGFVDGLVAAGFELRGKRAIVLGAGGAARAVAYGLRGSRAVEVVARRPADVSWAKAWPWTDEQLRECFARADLVVDCTSASLDGDDTAFAQSLPLEALPQHAWVTSLIYNRKPNLLERASERGHSTLDGKPMLVHQGARAFQIWTGMQAPVDVMTRALEAALA